MSMENLLWGAPRTHGELLKLGFELAPSSVAKYMVKRRGPPSQGWRIFLRNHAPDIAAPASVPASIGTGHAPRSHSGVLPPTGWLPDAPSLRRSGLSASLNVRRWPLKQLYEKWTLTLQHWSYNSLLPAKKFPVTQNIFPVSLR